MCIQHLNVSHIEAVEAQFLDLLCFHVGTMDSFSIRKKTSICIYRCSPSRMCLFHHQEMAKLIRVALQSCNNHTWKYNQIFIVQLCTNYTVHYTGIHRENCKYFIAGQVGVVNMVQLHKLYILLRKLVCYIVLHRFKQKYVVYIMLAEKQQTNTFYCLVSTAV